MPVDKITITLAQPLRKNVSFLPINWGDLKMENRTKSVNFKINRFLSACWRIEMTLG